MAHELEVIDGKASFFAARESAWHQLGTIVSEAQTTQQALKLAGLDYTVFKTAEPLSFQHRLTPGANVRVHIPGSYGTYRIWPDGRINGLGSVGSSYLVMQTHEAAELVEAITDQNNQAIWETGGSLRSGKQFFMTIKLGDEFTFEGSGDNIITYMVVASSHDGTMPLTVYFTRTRVVCANTLTWSLKGATSSYRVKHTTNSRARVTDAREALGLAWDGQDAFAKELDRLMHTTLTTEQADKVIEKLLPIDQKNDKPGLITLRTSRREQISDLYFGSPTVGAWSGTAYGMWNAVSEYEQWLAPSKGMVGSFERSKNVATRNVFDPPAGLSNRVLELL